MIRLILILITLSSFHRLAATDIDTSNTKIKISKRALNHTLEVEKKIKDCEKTEAIHIILSEAISVGAPTYNTGNHIGCYRIYEGAAYKILHRYGTKCKEVQKILESALEKSYGDYNATEKAWIMRMAFDKILGVPTVTK
jgi:hypothetical protein